MNYPVKVLSIGPEIIELHWPEEISEAILFEILTYKNWLNERWGDKIQRMYQGYQVLGMQLKTGLTNESLVKELREQLDSPIPKPLRPPRVRSWKIPVCYETALVPQLPLYLDRKSISWTRFVTLHTATLYRLYFYGFLPGFMYLGGLSEDLFIPRKTIPDKKISAGSVAIGGRQTGVYPMDSPGGWYVVGKTPVSFFKNGELQVPFRAGDSIRFESIPLAQFEELRQKETFCWTKWEDHG
jgi:inhibitor of KinA